MDKKQLTEADIRTKFITPALVGSSAAKWNVMTQLREEVFLTKGRAIKVGRLACAEYAKTIEIRKVLRMPWESCFDYMLSIITCPNPEHETCVAPSISRAKS
jgi:type I site-specific restriction endonuclease